MRFTPRGFAIALVGALAMPFACADDTLTGSPSGTTTSSATGAGGSGGGCVQQAAPCSVKFTYPFNNETSVELRGSFASDGWTNGVAMQLDGNEWTTSVSAADGTQIQYKFYVNGSTWQNDPNNQDTMSDGVGGVNNVVTASCPQNLCASGGASAGTGGSGGSGGTPIVGTYDWRSTILYFVFVDRFKDGDPSNNAPIAGVDPKANYQGGDYAGVVQKIDDGYFDDLGVNALWITVPMDNTENSGIGTGNYQYSAYHGYWPTKLDQTEEHFGTMADLKKVVDHAHQHKIKILFDYAMNHVHQDAPIYAQHPEWFWSLDYNGKNCVCGDGCDWNDPYEQKRCWFTPYLPDWNFTIPDARNYSVDNAIWWATQMGVDGFRLDAVKHIDPSWLFQLRQQVQQKVEPTLQQHFYMVGETFESSNRDLIKSFISPNMELDGQFDFPLRGAIAENLLRRTGSMVDFDNFLATNDTYYDPGIMSTFIGNHDILRSIQCALDQPWGAWDNGDPWDAPPDLPAMRSPFERMAVAFTFLLTTKGIPLIYYGDEIGMPGASDPDNRRMMYFTGYTADQQFLLDTIKKLTKARKQHTALWRGTRTKLSVTQDTYGYSMTDGSDVVYVAINRGDLDGGVAGMPASGHDLLSDTDVVGPNISLPPRTTMVIVPK